MKKLIILVTLFIGLTSCGTVGNNTDIINPDAEYLYFFGATCPHCQELNKRINDEDLFSEVSVEKREVYFNDDNREIFSELTKELGLKEWETWVPFVYDKISKTHAVWVDPALELFKSRLNWAATQGVKIVPSGEASSVETPEESNEDTIPPETEQ